MNGKWTSDGSWGGARFPLAVSPIYVRFLLRAENSAVILQAFADNRLNVYRPWYFSLSIRAWLCVCVWHCTMSGRTLVASEPGLLQARWKTEEEAWFQWYCALALPLISVHRLCRGKDLVYICVCMFVCRFTCAVGCIDSQVIGWDLKNDIGAWFHNSVNNLLSGIWLAPFFKKHTNTHAQHKTHAHACLTLWSSLLAPHASSPSLINRNCQILQMRSN